MSAFAGSFNITTDVATTVSSEIVCGFRPTCVIFWWSGRTESTDAAGSQNLNFGMGFAAGATDRRCMAFIVEDAQTTTDTGQNQKTDACIMELGVASGNSVGQADFNDFTDDGFRVIIDDAFPNDLRISFLALGGDHANAETGGFVIDATGAISDANVSFDLTGGLVLFLAVRFTTAPTANNSGVTWGFGAATGPDNEWVTSVFSGHNLSTSSAKRYGFGEECISVVALGSPQEPFVRADFTTLNTDGFTINVREQGADRAIYYLAINGGRYHVGDIVTATDTTEFSETGPGFQTTGVLFASVGTAEQLVDATASELKISVGAGTAADETTAQAGSDQTGLTTNEAFAAIDHDAVYIRPDLADGVEGVMDLTSLNSDGFSVIMDDADPDAAFVGYVAFGDAPPGGQFPEHDRQARQFLFSSPLLRM